MIYLYHGSGARDFKLLEKGLSKDEWLTLRQNACKLMKAKKKDKEIELLEEFPFEVYDGTNFFGDEFLVLYARIPIDDYVALEENGFAEQYTTEFRCIAEVISQLGPYIRHIAVDYTIDPGPAPVKHPSLKITSYVVEQALIDAQNLLLSSGPPSAIDRVHTAFHGFLKAVCDESGIQYPRNSSITELFKLIRKNHPKFQESQPNNYIQKVTGSMAAIIDALNPLRNEASIAHPNEKLLLEPEAMLMINVVRTLLHYLDSKLKIK